jgi:hypothetical protein
MKTLFNKSAIILFTIIIIAGLFSCSKQQQRVNNLNPDFKKYFDYQPGSYWVFYDSLNHHMDSLAVIGYTDKQVTINQGIIDEEVAIGMGEQNLDSLTNGIEWVLDLSSSYNSTLTIDIGFNEMVYGIADKMPFITGKNIDNKYDSGSYRQTTLFSSYNIENTTYNNVYQILYYYNATSYSDTFYINKDNGFIAILLNNQHLHKRLFLKMGIIVH